MARWSCSVEIDVSFPAANEEAAWARAEEIAAAMTDRLMGRRPPGYPRSSAYVLNVLLNNESGAVLRADS